MSFLDLLQPQGDKVTLTEMIFTKQHLPENTTAPIPDCMFKEDKTLDLEIFNILAWIIARRENNDITKEEVGDRIGILDPDQHRVITDEILYFFTTLTREQLSGLREKETEEMDVEEAENPTQEMEPQMAQI